MSTLHADSDHPLSFPLIVSTPANAVSDHPLSFPLTVLQRVYYPELGLPALSSTRVLLLGAGTLGTHLARSLLAWGVRSFTFVDCGSVSLTNPLRQPLFSQADVGRGKAGAAAAGLAALAPADYGLCARAVRLTIPSPGFGSPEEADVVTLAALIGGSDIVFNLTDTRAAVSFDPNRAPLNVRDH
jgi:ubiquitin-like modifier-activating enzyme ATG7